MSQHFEELINKLSSAHIPLLLRGIKRGLEKESLRVGTNGFLSTQSHPEALGSTLTHKYITTDYSEVLLELITPPSEDPTEPLKCLDSIHRFIYQNIGDDYLWNASMPCMLDPEKNIPIAYYGTSNSGRMKYIYRVGLGHRYGRLMQTISGLHYNFSIPQEFWKQLQSWDDEPGELQTYISKKYMGLIRNYHRFSWMLPFLFGASPAVCNCFLNGKKTKLKKLSTGTSYGPKATSLRMGDMGYSNNAQSKLNISYNSLDEYVAGLEHAINTPEPLYEKLGVKVIEAGSEQIKYKQLNANLLQIENEYYSNIRPKRVAISGERPAKTLSQGGVEYIEIRSLDINPFSPVGMTNEQIQWLDCFLVTCLLMDSPEISCREQAEISENLRRTVNEGREPGLLLLKDNRAMQLSQIGLDFSQKMSEVANLFDSCWNTKRYSSNVKYWEQCFEKPELTLSGKFMEQIQQQGSYYEVVQSLSLSQKEQFLEQGLTEQEQKLFKKEATSSLQKQIQMEEEPQIDFDEFLANYFKK